jgi:hypothetical protein
LARAADPDDARMRLRGALRRMIGEARLLVVPRGKTRWCAVQVFFNDNQRCRSYLIYYRAAVATPQARKESMWWVRSFAQADIKGDLDLRNREHVQRLERQLNALPLEAVREN